MSLIEDIRKIDTKFADALEEQKNAKDVLAASPWAWFGRELHQIFPSSHFYKTIPRERLSRILNLDFGYRHPMDVLRLLSLNRIGVGQNSDNLFFSDKKKAIIRLVLELSIIDDKKKPLWVKILHILSLKRKIYSSVEVAAQLGVSTKYLTNRIAAAPKFFHAHVGRKTAGIAPALIWIKKDSYAKIFAPLKPWLTPEGSTVFKKWKEKYHFGREVD